MNSSSTGEASDIMLTRKPGPQKPLHGMFLQLIKKPTYIVGSICEKLAVPQAAEMDSQQILPLRHVAEITTKNEGLHVLGIRFYYWLPVNLLKVYRRRRPSILGNRGRALITSRALCSLPVTLLSSP